MRIYKRSAYVVGAVTAAGLGALVGLHYNQVYLEHRAEESMEVRLNLAQLQSALARAGASNSHFILTGDTTFQRYVREAIMAAWEAYDRAAVVLQSREDGGQYARMDHLKFLILQREKHFQSNWWLRRELEKGLTEQNGRFDEARISPGFIGELRAVLDQLNQYEDHVAKRRIKNEKLTQFGFAVVVMIVLGTLLIHLIHTYDRIRDGQRAQEELLGDQKLLVRELNHRVKNSLQTVSSVLRLQMAKLDRDSEARTALKTAADRIHAVGKVHEQLYELQNRKLASRGFITRLIEDLSNTAPVEIYAKVEEVALSIDAAVPLSLLINELVTNAIKYGHDDREQAQIELTFGVIADKPTHWCLTVRDNGPGYPEGFDPRKVKSLGYKVILGLIHQLGGENVSFTNESGAVFRMEAPIVYTTEPA